jgi:hypothetical protein
VLSQYSDAVLSKIFKKYDTDGSGFLSDAEIIATAEDIIVVRGLCSRFLYVFESSHVASRPRRLFAMPCGCS